VSLSPASSVPPAAPSTSSFGAPSGPSTNGSQPFDLIAWDTAEKVAVRVAGREPLAESYHYASLEPDFREFTAEAEVLVARQTGLHSLQGPARVRVTDRAGWIRANLASFQRLLRPFTDRIGERINHTKVAPIGRQIAGAEVGALLGWMSTRVLGQYDMLVIENENPEDQDIVYYVGPNVLSLEKRFSFPPREFRLWLALHEVTHRAQFTGVPWLRPYFLSLVDASLAAFDPDPRLFLVALRRAVEELRAGRRPLDEGGLVTLLAGPEQQAILQQMQGLMSVLEGHGDITMDRAAADRIPSASRFRDVLHERRQSNGTVRFVQRLVGLEAKLRQYQEGEEFLEAIELSDPEHLSLLWEGSEYLPTLREIRDPDAWLVRVADVRAAAS
jgi:coenzyme F420 biosynthesis associated uncharacterized protein